MPRAQSTVTPPPTVSLRHTCENTGVYFVLTFWNRSLCNANVGCDGQWAATENFGGKEEVDIQGA